MKKVDFSVVLLEKTFYFCSVKVETMIYCNGLFSSLLGCKGDLQTTEAATDALFQLIEKQR